MARETAVESTEKSWLQALSLNPFDEAQSGECKVNSKIIRREGLYCRDTYSINRMHNP